MVVLPMAAPYPTVDTVADTAVGLADTEPPGRLILVEHPQRDIRALVQTIAVQAEGRDSPTRDRVPAGGAAR